MLKNIFKTAWRNLVRHPVNTSINVLGLALGIVVCLIIFLLVRFELGYDRFHPDGDRIYRIVEKSVGPDGEGTGGFVTTAMPGAVRSEVSGLETVAGFDNLYCQVEVPREGKGSVVFDAAKHGEETSPIIIAQPQYFDIFKYKWLAGNAATALNEPFRVVLTEKEAERYFGPGGPDRWLGRTLIYHDSIRVTVSGIVADWKENSDFAFRDFISFPTIKASFLRDDFEESWGMWDFDVQTFVKLAPGVSPARVERQLAAMMDRHKIGPKEFHTYLSLQPLNDIHYNEKYPDDFSRKASLPSLYGLGGIALFILLIAAINFINLSTAQSVRRAREIGVRKVLGGRRGALVVQFLCETLVLVLAAAILALLIAGPLVLAFQSLLPREVELQIFVWPTLWFLVAIVVVTCLLAGFYPARVLAAYQPVLSLKGQGIRQLNNKSYLRKALIVFQFTVSLIFIIGTLIVARQIHFMLSTDLGFDHDAIVIIGTPREGTGHPRATLAAKIREIPEVELVTQNIEAPTATGHPGTFLALASAANARMGDPGKIMASFDMVDTNYLRLFGMHLVVGRNLFQSDTIGEFLVNETAARELGFRRPADALGQIVTCGMNNATGSIVGVVKDFHSKSMHEPITPFFISTGKGNAQDISIKLATKGRKAEEMTAVLGKLEKAWKEVYPAKKFGYVFFDESIAQLYDKEKKLAEILDLAMGVAIFISCLGLWGLAAWVAEQRTKEIGIRKVLGATVVNIVGMLSKDFLWLVVLAIVIASPVAWYFMHMWLQDFVYRVSISWWIYAVAGVGAIAIALLTVSVQAVRAATVNPVESLRME